MVISTKEIDAGAIDNAHIKTKFRCYKRSWLILITLVNMFNFIFSNVLPLGVLVIIQRIAHNFTQCQNSFRQFRGIG